MSIINTPTVSAELAESKLNKPPIEPKSSLGDLGVKLFYNGGLCPSTKSKYKDPSSFNIYRIFT